VSQVLNDIFIESRFIMEKLRFKNNGDHYQEKLILKNSQVLKERKESLQKDNGLPHVSLTKNGIVLKTDRYNRDFLVRDEDKNYKVTKIGDLCYNPANLKFGVITLNEQIKGVFSPIYVTFEISKKMDTKFAKYFYTRKKYINKLRKFEEGTVYERMAVKPSDFLKVEITLPSLNEQEKIGGFLSTFDKLIEKQQDKIGLLKKLKKGYLQNMFPKSDENVPEIRFKGFTDAWEQRELGQLTEVYDGTHQTPQYTDNGVMFLSVENIATLKSEKFISEEAFKNEFKIYPQKNDILMTRIGDIGTANIVADNEPKAYYVSLALLKNAKLYPHFLKESISSVKVKREIWHRTLHIAFPKKINKNEISKVRISYPKINVEQLKIGKTLNELDKLITLHRHKLDQLENLKKGYMQRLFA
jgi:type I restriction enzyme, S subunit